MPRFEVFLLTGEPCEENGKNSEPSKLQIGKSYKVIDDFSIEHFDLVSEQIGEQYYLTVPDEVVGDLENPDDVFKNVGKLISYINLEDISILFETHSTAGPSSLRNLLQEKDDLVELLNEDEDEQQVVFNTFTENYLYIFRDRDGKKEGVFETRKIYFLEYEPPAISSDILAPNPTIPSLQTLAARQMSTSDIAYARETGIMGGGNTRVKKSRKRKDKENKKRSIKRKKSQLNYGKDKAYAEEYE